MTFRSELGMGLQPKQQKVALSTKSRSHLKISLYLKYVLEEGEKRKQETAKRRQNVIKS